MNLFITALLLFSCTTNSHKQDNAIHSISIKENIQINKDLIITLTKIEDSRCPTGAQCFTQGHAKIYLQIQSGNEAHSYQFLSTDKMPITLGKHTVHFVELSPYPKVNQELKQSDYHLKFKME